MNNEIYINKDPDRVVIVKYFGYDNRIDSVKFYVLESYNSFFKKGQNYTAHYSYFHTTFIPFKCGKSRLWKVLNE